VFKAASGKACGIIVKSRGGSRVIAVLQNIIA
jgi:hypothetical protein